MKKMLHRSKQVSDLVGVEVYLLEQGKYRIRYATLKQKKSRAIFDKGEYHLETFDELKAAIGRQIPLVLSISGHGIIHRSFEIKDGANTQDYLSTMLPNVGLDLFYKQESRTAERVFISLIRKETLDDLQAVLEIMDLPVFSISLGSFALLPLMLHTEAPSTGTFRLDGHQFILREGEVVDYELLTPMSIEAKKIKFAKNELNECLAIAYATALCYVANLSFPQVVLPDLQLHQEEYFNQVIFKKLLPAITSLFLLALVVNACMYYRYASNISSYETDRIPVLQSEEKKLKQILDNKLAVDSIIIRPRRQNIPFSRIADLLAANVPSSITLQEMIVFPLDKESSRKQRRPAYDFKRVRIHGSCETGRTLNEWISTIRKIDFCQNVEIKEYASKKAGESVFQIELSIMQP